TEGALKEMFLAKLKLTALLVPVLLTGLVIGTAANRPTSAAAPGEPPAPTPKAEAPAAPEQPDRPVAEAPEPRWSWTGPRNPVATIFGDVQLSRAEFGEFLIERSGDKALGRIVNKRIIEVACHRKGITVTDEEVEAALRDDLTAIRVSREAFVGQVLKQYGKTLVEWKEDVLRPRLLLAKLGYGRVTVT